MRFSKLITLAFVILVSCSFLSAEEVEFKDHKAKSAKKKFDSAVKKAEKEFDEARKKRDEKLKDAVEDYVKSLKSAMKNVMKKGDLDQANAIKSVVTKLEGGESDLESTDNSTKNTTGKNTITITMHNPYFPNRWSVGTKQADIVFFNGDEVVAKESVNVPLVSEGNNSASLKLKLNRFDRIQISLQRAGPHAGLAELSVKGQVSGKKKVIDILSLCRIEGNRSDSSVSVLSDGVKQTTDKYWCSPANRDGVLNLYLSRKGDKEK